MSFLMSGKIVILTNGGLITIHSRIYLVHMVSVNCQQLSKSTQLTDTMCTKYIREWIVLRPPLVRITIVPDIRNDIRIQIKVFISCQRNKKEVLKYDHLPAKEAGPFHETDYW